MEYLNTFDTMQDYLNAKDNLTLPSASLIEETKEVIYDKYDPYNGYDYVEIGGKKWATMNVGANSITDGGLYFQWADTQGYTASQVGNTGGKKAFDWTDYKYNSGGSNPTENDMSKYNSTDEKTVLDLTDDAANANMGGEWRMPTKDELTALRDATDAEWVSNYNGSDVAGLLLTSKTDSTKKLFFPACGYCVNGSIQYPDSQINCLSSSIFANDLKFSYTFIVNSLTTIWVSNQSRNRGCVVRAVID